jgi:GT2 family glycosyltransferase
MLLTCPEASFGFGEMESVSHAHPEHVNYYYRDNKQPTGIYPVERILPLFMRLNRTSGWFVGDLIRASSYRQAGGLARDPINYSGDYALALRLLELGGKVVYINSPVGKHRVWQNEDGKIDAIRTMASIEDTLTLVKILEDSDFQQRVGQWFVSELAKVKKHKAMLLALMLLQAIAKGELTPDQARTARATIQGLGRSPGTTALLSLCNPKLNSLLRLVHPYALRLIRTRPGRKLLD